MPTFRRAMIGVGRGTHDAPTMQQAAYLGQALGVEQFDLVHVLRKADIPPELAQPLDQKLLQDEMCEHMERLRDGCTAWPEGSKFELFVLQGSPGEQMIKLASQEDTDVICIGRQRDKPQDTLGLAASRLVHHCPCSVLVASHDVPSGFRKLLCPVDFSPHSIEALEIARRIASARPDGEVIAQFVYSVPPGFDKVGDTFDEFATQLRKHAEARWEDVRSQLVPDRVDPQMRFDLIPQENWSDKPADVIVRTASEIDADLIVCGAKGHSAVARFLLGSTSEGILKQTKRSTLCVKRKGEHVGLLRAVFGEEW